MDPAVAKQDFCGAPSPGTRKAVGARRRSRWVLWAGVLVLGSCAFPTVLPVLRGGDLPDPGSSLSTSARDMTLAVHVRRALLEDPVLGPLNLGVKVQDGAVVLVGPVPAPEIAQKALRLVADVRGVRGVRSELYLSRDNQHERIPIPLEGEAPTRTQSASPDPASGTLTGRVPAIELPPSGRPAAPQPSSPPQAPPAPPPQPPAPAPPSEKSEWGTTPAAGGGVSLLAPIGVVPQAAAPAAATGDLASAVDRVRQSQPRFRRIWVEVRGTTILLSGPDVPAEDVMALAQALSVLPGVQRVHVQNIPSSGR
jgi:hyperosmotically inducible periplasmic protein